MRFSPLLAALTAIFAMLAPASRAEATTVSPVVVDLQSNGRGVVANINVSNTGPDPLPIEVQLISLRPTMNGLEPAGTDIDEDLLITPPSVLIPAGQTQSFRVQWIGDPDLTTSKHYYVSINQLPVKLAEGQSAVQVVYNFQVLVSVSAPDKKAELTVTAVEPTKVDGKTAVAITVHNDGTAHGYMSQKRLKISGLDASGKEVMTKTISGSEFQQIVGYGLIATGQTRTLNVPIEALPASAKLVAVLQDERAR